MGKTKKKSAQNPNAVAKQSIDKMKSGSVQKNKNPKLKSTPEKTASMIDNVKMQKKNKLPEKTTKTKDYQNLLQNILKEVKKGEQYSLKGKKNVSKNKSQKKSVNKEMIKILEIVNSESEEDFEEEEEKKKQTVECKGVKVSKDIESKLEEDNNDDSSSTFVTDDSEEENVPDILGKSLADESEEDDEDFKEEDKDDDGWVTGSDSSEASEGECSKNKIAEENWKSSNLESDDNDDEDDSDDFFNDDGDPSEDESFNVKDAKCLPDVKQGKYAFFPDGVVNRTTIKVLHLPKTICEAKVRKMFIEFGFILSVILRTEKKTECNIVRCEGRPSDAVSAIIKYNCPISARRAFSFHRRLFDGEFLHVQYVEKPNLLPIFDSSKCVWLSNLMFGVDTNSIWKKFRRCGEIECVKVFRNPRTGYTTGFAYVVFTTNKAVKEALKLNGTIILSREVRVHAHYIERDRKDEVISNEIEGTKKKKKNFREIADNFHKTNDNNTSKKFKNNSGEAVARKGGNEKQQISQKSSVGLVEKKPTSLQSQKAFNKQKKKTLTKEDYNKELRNISKNIVNNE